MSISGGVSSPIVTCLLKDEINGSLWTERWHSAIIANGTFTQCFLRAMLIVVA